MFILQLSDFWINIGETLQELWNQVGSWNWDNILKYFQNVSLGTVALGILTITAKVGIPLLKNSNKPVLKSLGDLYDKINVLEKKDQTISNVLKEWIGLQSDINQYSKTLKPEHKEAFKNLAVAMRMVDNQEIQEAADKIDEIIEDNKIDVAEVQELIESTELGEVVMEANINDIIPKGE